MPEKMHKGIFQRKNFFTAYHFQSVRQIKGYFSEKITKLTAYHFFANSPIFIDFFLQSLLAILICLL